MPAPSDTLANLPRRNVLAYSGNTANDLVAGCQGAREDGQLMLDTAVASGLLEGDSTHKPIP